MHFSPEVLVHLSLLHASFGGLRGLDGLGSDAGLQLDQVVVTSDRSEWRRLLLVVVYRRWQPQGSGLRRGRWGRRLWLLELA